MGEVSVTKDAYKVLCCMWKIYLTRVGNGMSKVQAKSFDSEFYKSDKELLSWHEDDMNNNLNELVKAQLITRNVLGGSALHENAVIHMENKFKNNVNAVVDFISKLIP